MRACTSPARRLAPVVLAVAALTLGACTSAAADMTPVTVTVYPTQVAAPAPSTPIPTRYAGATAPGDSAQGVSAGHLNGAPADVDEAIARVTGAENAESVQGVFTSPTGNIFCSVVDDGAVMACELAEGRVPAPGICPPGGPQEVRRLELGADAVKPACSDTIREPDAEAPKLRYARRTVVAGTPIQCLSEKVGITCVDTTGRRGFFLAKGTFATF
jgi:hypothetical protein